MIKDLINLHIIQLKSEKGILVRERRSDHDCLLADRSKKASKLGKGDPIMIVEIVIIHWLIDQFDHSTNEDHYLIEVHDQISDR